MSRCRIFPQIQSYIVFLVRNIVSVRIAGIDQHALSFYFGSSSKPVKVILFFILSCFILFFLILSGFRSNYYKIN